MSGRKKTDTKPSLLLKSAEVITYLDNLLLPEALWWFIENASDETAWRSAVFFHLRARVRTAEAGSPVKKGSKRKPVCPKCGSDDVVSDAVGRWDSDAQAWELVDVSSKGHSCGCCGASNIRFKWITCTDADES